MRRSLMQDYGEEDEEVVEIIIVIMIKTSEWVFSSQAAPPIFRELARRIPLIRRQCLTTSWLSV